MTSGYDAFLIFHAIARHFTSPSYDYFKYRGKTNVTPNAWYKRNDKYHFEVLGAKYKPDELIGIFVSYYLKHTDNTHPWGGELINWARSGYVQWQGDIERMAYLFEEDLMKMKATDKSLKKWFVIPANTDLPPIVSMVIQKKINIVTLIILTDLVGGTKRHLDKCEENLLWPDVKQLIGKYRPFLNYKAEKYEEIVKKVFLC